MSSTAEAATIEHAEPRATTWALWGRQVTAILRLESRKNFLGKRAVLMYLLASLPVMLLIAMAAFPPTARRLAEPGFGQVLFAFIYEGLVLRAVVFFGCAWIFMNLFRGEIVDRSLHYYLLSAVRREVLIAGKFLSGLVAAAVLFGGATLVCLAISFLPRGGSGMAQHLFQGPGLGHAAGYLGVTLLACLGYGAVFLAIGLVFRNPIVPALVIYGWEMINFLLPPVLKKISVIHYLQSLSPVPVSEGPFAILAEPTPAWIAVPGFLVMTAIVFAFAAWRIKTLEIRYGGE
jgi:ABC-type transport system involved in multi-copper enzyme maturation permease subunit